MDIFSLIPQALARTQFKKFFIGFLAFSLFFTQVFGFMPVAGAFSFGSGFTDAFADDDNEIKEVYDVIALVVEEDLLNGGNYSAGLISEYPDKLADTGTLDERIMRFAEDLQKDSPRTVVKTINYDPDEHTLLDVITALENLYKNGDNSVESRLRGLVLIGEVPLPVVSKSGNRFISMFPLTDFDDKAYVFNPTTESFEENPDVSFPKAEIWHGILRAPQLDDEDAVSEEELNKLAEYFDKNHLYHAGVEDFAEFQRKMFFGDFVQEDKKLNEDIYKLYLNFLKHMDDLAYMRFNKHWAQSLLSVSMGEFGEDMFALAPNPSDYADGSAEKEQAQASQAFQESVGDMGNTFDKLPDIHSKNIIENFHKQYIDTVARYLADTNDLMEGTVRYAIGGTEADEGKTTAFAPKHDSSKNGIDTLPALISMKDKYTQQYFRMANDALEMKVNELVEKMNEPLPLIDMTEVAGTIEGEPFEIKYDLLSTFGSKNPKEFVPNLKMKLALDEEDGPPTGNGPLLFKNHFTDTDGKMYINGVSSDYLESPKQCFPYLGSMYEPGSDEYSVLTRSLRTDNPMSSTQTYTLGVNGFSLSSVEASKLTNGQFDYGYIVEPYPEYGYPAFYNNSPLQSEGMEEGDLILGMKPRYVINAKKSAYVKEVEHKISEDESYTISLSGKVETGKKEDNILLYSNAPLVKCDDCSDNYTAIAFGKVIKKNPKIGDDPFSSPDGVFAIDDEFYYLGYEHDLDNTETIRTSQDFRNAESNFVKIVSNPKKGGSDKNAMYWDAYSSLTVIYYDVSHGSVGTAEVAFEDFVPYSSTSYNSHAYEKNDLNGCFFTSGILHDDRCFALTANYPVLDPAGSFEPYHPDHMGVYGVKDEAAYYFKGQKSENLDVDDVIYEYQFPIGMEVFEQDEETEAVTHETHKEMFQKPASREFSEIDEIYMDGCYSFLPYTSGWMATFIAAKVAEMQAADENFVPPGLGLMFGSYNYYSWTTLMMNKFGNKEGKKNQNIPYGGNGRNVPLVDTTDQFVLHGESDDPDLSLGTFARYYGLYDGVDNDGDGHTDYVLLDQDGDGLDDSFILDLGEAVRDYALDPDDINAVGRSLLGKQYKWKNPPYANVTVEDDTVDVSYVRSYSPYKEAADETEYWFPLLKDMNAAMSIPGYNIPFDIEEEIVLKVKPLVFKDKGEEKYFSSMIVHNEPTNYTIGKQVESGIAQSLPIDDPRYVAFMDEAGDTREVIYPNLYKSGSHAQFLADIDSLATEILKIPGAHRLGDIDGDVKEYIKKELLSVSTSSADENYEFIKHMSVMTTADGNILKDALNWNSLSIDDKHEYVLQYYLNDSDEFEPYIHDNGLGYETAYLVFDGGSLEESDYIDLGFNREGFDDTDPSFDPFAGGDYETFAGTEEEESSDDDESFWEFVGLFEFWGELKRFGKEMKELVTGFDAGVELKGVCGGCEEEDDECVEEVFDYIEVLSERLSLYSDGVDSVDLLIFGYNDQEGLYNGSYPPSLELIISQDELNPVLRIEEIDQEKVLEKGQATYRVYSTKNPGKATVTVNATFSPKAEMNDISSEPLELMTTGKKVEVIGDAGSFIAGSDEEITVSARLIADDELETNAGNEITFKIFDEGEGKAEFVGSGVANAENGVASVNIKPLTKAGLFTVQADVSDGPFYATGVKEFATLPDDPYKVEVLPDTNVLEANGESKAHIIFELRDQFGNLLSASFEQIAVFVFGDAKLDESTDRDKLLPGIQLAINEGKADLDLYAKDKIGEANVYAVYLSHELGNTLAKAVSDDEAVDFAGSIATSKTFTILGETKTQVVVSDLDIDADGVSTTDVVARLTKTNGEVLTGYNGPVVININDQSLVQFVKEPPVRMYDGEVEFAVQSTTKAGTVNIDVTVPGFSRNSVDVITLPGDPVALELVSDVDTVFTNSTDEVVIQAVLLDQYDNVAYLDSAPVTFSTTATTSHLVHFASPEEVYAVNGYAQAEIVSTGNSGVVNLVVTSDVGGPNELTKGTLSLDLKKRISNVKYNNFEKFSPRALYVNLLGAPFSDFGKDDLASALLYNGKTQAILSVTADPDDKKRVLFVDGYGQVDVLDPNVISTVVNASDSFGFTRVKFTDQVFGEEVGEMFVVPKDGLPFVLLEGEFADYEEGILVAKLGEEGSSPTFEYTEDEKKILIKNKDETLASIDKYGRISIVSKDVSLRVPGKNDPDVDKSYFSILMGYGGKAIGQIMYKQTVSDVAVLPSGNKSSAFLPGVYLKLAGDHDHFAVKTGFSKYSTEFLKGSYVIDLDKDLDPSMSPGFGYSSLENAKKSGEVGFSYDNKNMLLFASGNSVGEANIPYASEVGVLLGDPTVRIDNTEDDLVLSSGFTRDIGQLIHSEDDGIQDIEAFDYNGDGYDDLLITLRDGRLKLLENEESNQRFVDRGILLQIANGVYSLSKIDIDSDGFDDLIIGTRDSCIKGEKCLYLYKNENGNFVRQKMDLNFGDKIYDIQTEDLNDDGLPDIVLSDSAGTVYVFWNDGGEINPNGDKLSNFGLVVDDDGLIDDIAVHYAGMPQSSGFYGAVFDMTFEADVTFANTLEAADQNQPAKPVKFILPSVDPRFAVGSYKSIVDMNGAPLEIGDTIKYTIVFKNSGAALNDLVVSDIIPSAQDIDEDSLACLDVGCKDELVWKNSDLSLRSRVIRGVSVPAGGTRTLTYEATITATPVVDFNIGNFEIGTEYDDEYLDILVRPQDNPDEGVTYFYSDGVDDSNHVVYSKKPIVSEANVIEPDSSIDGIDELEKNYQYVEPDPMATGVAEGDVEEDEEESDEEEEGSETDNAGEVVAVPTPTEPPKSVQKLMDELSVDTDNDMVPDSWDELRNAYVDKMKADEAEQEGKEKEEFDLAKTVVGAIEAAISFMRCEGQGCLPIPYNYAFLVPSVDNPTGGYAVLAIGSQPCPPCFAGFYPTASSSSIARLYLSPTLTLGLGTALCIGQSPSGLCLAAALPVSKNLLKGICQAIDDMLSGVAEAAKYLVTTAQGAATMLSDGLGGNPGADAQDGSGTTTHNGSYGSADGKMQFQDSINIRIPGFPSVITDWLDAQMEEIFNKLLDLPDFYIILPDFGSLFKKTVAAGKDFGTMTSAFDFLNRIAQIPLIQIKGEEVTLKIPMINADQIKKWQRQAELFMKNLEDQWKKMKEFWTCDENSNSKTVCEKVTVKMTRLMANVQKVLDLIEMYKNLPKNILELRMAEVKYANQLICYLDKIMDLTGGYVKKQGKIIRSWIRMIDDIIKQFRSWKALLNLSVDYQESCDKCKNEKYGEMGVMMQLFAAIPDPPIVPMFKWPNFVIDLSKVEMGLEVIWPDIVFKPQPIVLPDLPTINLPEFIPDIEIDLDALIPDFDIGFLIPPSFDIDLPDLPPLPLPELPDLPRPPKIPKLPKVVFDLAAVLKVLFKIVCLLKEGFMPLLESQMKSEIEELTQPGVKPLLPLTISFGMQMPSIEYSAPTEFNITLRTKFGANTRVIFEVVDRLAEWYNKKIEDFVNEFNKYSRSLKLPDYITDLDAAVKEGMSKMMQEDMGVAPDWMKDQGIIKADFDSTSILDDAFDGPGYYLAADTTYVNPETLTFGKSIEDLDYVDAGQYADNPYMAEVADLRNSLLAYAKGVSDSNELLGDMDNYEEFTRFIVEGDGLDSEESDDLNKIVSRFGGFEIDRSERLSGDEKIVKIPMVTGLEEEGDRERILLADASDYDFKVDPSQSMPKSNPPGIFEFVPGETAKENILAYTAELGSNVTLLKSDIDNDGDLDLVLSMGRDVYLKENYKEDSSDPIYPILKSPVELDDYLDDGHLSVQGYEAGSGKNGAVKINFAPSNSDDIVGYEVAVIPSLIDMDKNKYNGGYRFLLLNEPQDVFGFVEDVYGVDNVLESPVREIHSSPDEFDAYGGDVFYAVEDSGFVLNPDKTNDSIEVEVDAGEFYVVEDGYPSFVSVSLLSGEIELLSSEGEAVSLPLIEGDAFVFGNKIVAGNNSGSVIEFTNGAEIEVHENEVFEVIENKNPEEPNIELKMPNGNYYSVIYSIASDGEKSFASTQSPLAPQICGDDDAPLPALSNPFMRVAVTKTLEINASGSFDPAGEIMSYYLDLDLTKDKNGDGNPINDPDLWSDLDVSTDGLDGDGNVQNDKDNPAFKLGPFEEIGERKVSLNIVDLANNVSSQIVTIQVYVPNISLDPLDVETAVASGKTDPSTDDMPFSLMRRRYIPRVEDGALKLVSTEEKIVTPAADKNGQYKTLNNGDYAVDDFNLENIILILDAKGEIVAEVSGETGNFWVDEESGYYYETHSAQPPTESTKTVIYGPGGEEMGTIYVVAEGNSSVYLHEEMEFTNESIEYLFSVNVNDVDVGDEFEFRQYPSNDPNYPNGAYLYYKNEKKHVAAIDTAGNILVLDERVTLAKKDNLYKYDPFVYEILFEGKKVAEVYVDPDGLFDEVQIVGPKDVPRKFPSGVTPQYLYEEEKLAPSVATYEGGGQMEPPTPVFTDLAGEIYDYAMNLFYQGVINGDETFDSFASISRADFVVMLIKMLCIIPREEAYDEPSVFNDISYDPGNLIYYYPYVKEAALLGLVQGYGVSDGGGQVGDNPFAPGETITLAEASKIIINGLGLIGAIDSSGLKDAVDGPWYAPYIEASQDLTPYAATGVTLKNSYIITKEEAQNPAKEVTKGELLTMAYRVMDAYNCFEVDKDADGMSDYCENDHKIDDPEADLDNDGLSNSEECTYGTDPKNADTDAGGVSDGDEVKYGTNPLYAPDDQNDTDGDGLLDIEELNIYHTDPDNWDTDGGGKSDGFEVNQQTNPLEYGDDLAAGEDGEAGSSDEVGVGQVFETEPGVYLVPPECTTCPCLSTFKYKADLRKGDILYTIIVNEDETIVYSKSNEQKVQ
jgi:uncharacterized repeat protein (TIGR01451 family)